MTLVSAHHGDILTNATMQTSCVDNLFLNDAYENVLRRSQLST